MKNSKLSIRPTPRLGESITSILLRAGALNACDVMDVWRYVHNGSKYMLRSHLFYRLDYDFQMIELEKLKELLNISSDSLRRLSFFTVCSKFLDDPYRDFDRASLMIQSEIYSKTRRYCPLCFKEEKVFKLIWQVKTIDLCGVHCSKLRTSCPHCLNPIDYKSDYMCCGNPGCTSKLWNTPIMEKVSKSSPFELKNHERWSFLLDPNRELTIKYNNLNMERSLALKLLFVAQNQEEVYIRKNIVGIGGNIAKTLASFVRGNSEVKKVTIKLLFEVLDFSGMSIIQFESLKIPNSYIQSIFTSKEKRVKLPQECLSGWCNNLKALDMLLKDERVEPRKTGVRYPYYYVCPNCFMRYSHDPLTKKWIEIDGRIELLMTVKELAEKGMTRSELSRELKINIFRISELFGYLAYYQLLSKPICRRYTTISVPSNLVSLFAMLDCEYRSYPEKKYKRAKELFNWNLKTFSYYYAHSTVQLYYFKKISNLKKPLKKNYNIHNEVQDSISQLIRANIKLSYAQVAAAMDRSEKTLQTHGIKEIVEVAKEKQISQNLNLEEKQLRQKIDEYIKLHDANKRILMRETYAYLQKNRDYIVDKYPGFINYMTRVVKNFNEGVNKRKFNDKISLIKDAIVEIHTMQKTLSITAVASYLEIKYIHVSGYKSIKEIIIQEIDNFVSKKSFEKS
jgi:hypothetical protein